MSRRLYLALSIALLAAAGCVKKDLSVPESTTSVFQPGEELVARSADGLFELVVPAEGLEEATEIVISTVRGATPPGASGLVYAVLPERLHFQREASVRVYVPQGLYSSRFGLAGVEARRAAPIVDAVFDVLERRVRAGVAELTHPAYTLLAAPYDPCAGGQCGDACQRCDPRDPACDVAQSGGTCDMDGACAASVPTCTTATSDGWGTPAGQGLALIVNSLAIAPEGVGFDLDHRCTQSHCIDNALAPMGEVVNDQLRQGLLGGESLLMFETAGLDLSSTGDDRSATLRYYLVRDADDPFFPANNFRVPPGHTTCCEFHADATAVMATEQGFLPRVRMPARVSGWRLSTLGNARLPFSIGRVTLILDDVRVALNLDPSSGAVDGVIGGVFTVSALSEVPNPYCRTVSPRCPVQMFPGSSMADMVAVFAGQPDIDRDGDGLERFEDTDGDGIIDRCLDGCIGACTAPEEIPPVVAGDPRSCMRSTRAADGYSTGGLVSAVPAHLTHVTPPVFDSSKVVVLPPIDGQVHMKLSADAFGGPYSKVRATSGRDGTERVASVYPYWWYGVSLPGLQPGDQVTLTALDPFGASIDGPSGVVTVPACPPEGCGAHAGESLNLRCSSLSFETGCWGELEVSASDVACQGLQPDWVMVVRHGADEQFSVVGPSNFFFVPVFAPRGDTIYLSARDASGRRSAELPFVLPP